MCQALLDAARVPTVPPRERRGLPIGNLTSQFWANVYLDPLDQHALTTLGATTWVRYMDDILVFGPDKKALWETAEAVTDFAREVLGLTMKVRATLVAPVHDGVPWLARPSAVSRASLRSLVGHAAHANTHALRQAWVRASSRPGQSGTDRPVIVRRGHAGRPRRSRRR